MNKIVIDLSKPNLPDSISDAEFVQQRLKDELVATIESSIRTTTEETHEEPLSSPVFFIDGTRGAGKTTFLNAMVKRFDQKSLEGKRGSKKILALPCIDPTKLPASEPILVTVIAKLNSSIEKHLNHKFGWDNQQQKEREWRNRLERLSIGIRLLTAERYTHEFFDDALQLNAQLDNSKGGLDLAFEFHQLVTLACDILGCDAILVAFDDIDTQFSTGWNVLEAIRCFFSSPKLIVLITGDLRLYSQLTRGKQYENYDKTHLQQEREEERIRERSQMVEHLEQQYLLKLFPVQHRVQLQSMYQMLSVNSNADLMVKIGVVAQISQQIMISPAPSDRYTRGFLTGRPRVFSLFIALTYAITSPT
ncbi:hypothetical protein [Aeromonas salmonicida]|uniref:hypothetical protein n=1 Tax=Aeromonas salmonicida TaxID=645 RepID=UPI0013200178|nr:hypothetical protein [Aeromonas salmonicida]QHE45048.1 hypothetical protein GO992_18775 [Aeromonas salmonicida subsp. salmonicida]QHE46851.1 hypothetical protein GO994_05545 [Aeromonas salmonicida subsp. salmonicida]